MADQNFRVKRGLEVGVGVTITAGIVTAVTLLDGNLNAPGKTYYVATNGNNSYAGTSINRPFATLVKALSVATSGDTIFIQSGTFTEVFPLTIPVGVTVKGSGIRATFIQPTSGTQQNDGFLLNGETTVEDLSIGNIYEPGYAFKFASNAKTTTRSPYIQRVTVLNKGSVITSTDPYGFDTAHSPPTSYKAGRGALIDGSVQNVSSLEPAMLFNECTFITPNNTALEMTNGARTEWVNCFTYLADKGIYAYDGNVGFASTGYVRIKTAGITTSTSTPTANDELYYLEANSQSATYAQVGTALTITRVGHGLTVGNRIFADFTSGTAPDGFYRITGYVGVNTFSVTMAGSATTSGNVSYKQALGFGTVRSYTSATGLSSITAKGEGLFEIPSSRLGKTVTAYGDAQLSTTQKKFGNASLYLDGTGDYARCEGGTDFAFSGNFTVETWIYPTSVTGTRYIFALGTETTGRYNLSMTGGVLSGNFYGSGSTSFGGSISANTWTHIALVRSGSTISVYVNGTALGTTETNSSAIGNTGQLTIGADTGGTSVFVGYFDEFRISNTARYTGTFSVATAAFTSDGSDKILLHFDGIVGSTSFADSSVATQDIRWVRSGVGIATATKITLADYQQFGAEMRSIGSAAVFGNTGVSASGPGVGLRLFAFNFGHIGSGKDFSQDVSLVNQAAEVVTSNNANVYFVSIDQGGDFRVGSAFYVNQKAGSVNFGGQNFTLNSLSDLNVTDGTNTNTITPTTATLGNIQISGNDITSTSGNININPSGASETFVDGNLNVSGILTASVLQTSALQIGDTSVAIDDTGSNGTIRFNTDNVEALRVTNVQKVGIGSTAPTSKLDVTGDIKVSGVVTATTFSGNVSSGVATITTANITTDNITTANIVTGIVTTISGTNLSYTGVATISQANITTANISSANIVSGIITTLNGTNLNYSGVGTIAQANITTANISGANIVSGIVTTINGTNLNYSGVGTIAQANITTANISGANIVSGIITTLNGTNLNYTGVATISQANITTDNITTANIVTGIVTTISGTNLNYSGVGTIAQININVGNIGTARIVSGIVTTISGTNLSYTGVGTIGQANITTANISGANIVAGVVTTISGTNLNYSGVGTIGQVNSTQANIATANIVSGIVTTISGTNLSYTGANIVAGVVTTISGTNLNYSGVGTIGQANITTANISGANIVAGVVTTISGTNLNYSGVGTIGQVNSTQANIATANIVSGIVTTISGTNLNYIGIGTITTRLDVGAGVTIGSGVVTATSRLSTGNTGVGINITTNTISGPAELVIDPAGVGDNTGAVRIKGDLLVDGTQTFINSTAIELADFNVGIATTVGTNALLDGAGIGIGSTNIRKTITWNNTAQALTSSEDWNLASGKNYEINGTVVLTSTTLTASNINATGVSTIGQANITTANISGANIVSGIVTTINGTNLNYSGVGTIGQANITTANVSTANIVSGIVTTINGTNLNYSGVGTIGQANITTANISGANIVSGIVTTINGTNLNYSGVGTIGQANITTANISGANIVSGIVTTINGTNLNYSGVGTIGQANITTANVSTANIVAGVVTTISGTNLNYSGVGTIAQININVGNIGTARIVSGIITTISGTNLNYTGVSTFTTGPVLISNTGTATTTGTASQPLQVTGGAYVSGPVGIATTNPLFNLHVAGSSSGVGATIAQFDNNSTGTRISIVDETTVGAKPPGIRSRVAAFGLGLYASAGPLIIYNNVLDVERARVFTSGEVGIGTTILTGTSSQLLQVGGGAYVNGFVGIGTTNPTNNLDVKGTVYIDSRLGIGRSNSAYPLTVNGPVQSYPSPAYNSSYPGFSGLEVFNGGFGGWFVGVESNTNDDLRIRTSTSSGIPNTSSVAAIQINRTSLNVGINSTSPTSRLDVVGDVKISNGLSVTGVSTFAGITTVTGTTLFAKQLNVTGVSTFGSDIYIGNQRLFENISNFFVRSPANIFLQNTDGSNYASFITGAETRLYYANSKKFETTNDGILVTGVTTTSTLIVGTGGTTITTTSSSLVGIGTINPTSKLTVVGNIKAGYASTVGIILGVSPVGVPTNDFNSYILWGDDVNFGGANGDLIYIPRTSTNTSHRFYTGSPTPTEALRITSSQNVLVGTQTATGTASQALQVNSGAYVSGSVGIGSTNPQKKLDVQGGNGFVRIGETYIGYNGITLNNDTADTSYNVLSSSTDKNLYLNRPTTWSMNFRMGNVDQMILNPSGNLGINSAAPTSRLDVVGDAKISGVVTATSVILGVAVTSVTNSLTNSGIGTTTTSVAITASGSIDGTAFESFELDDLSSATDGKQNTFVPTFNYDRVTITNPFRLLIIVNGVTQSAFINNTDYVYQSNFLGSNNGYTIDSDNNIKFTESVPTGSEIIARVLPVSNTPTRIRNYPFKPTDILLGY